MYLPSIRAAKEWGKRPTEMIFGDPAFGFREGPEGVVYGEVSWTSWDYALVQALQLIEDYTTDNGLLIWEVDNTAENVMVSAERYIDRFEASRDSITGRKNYKSSPGERFRPRLDLRYGEWPTFEDWVKKKSEDID